MRSNQMESTANYTPGPSNTEDTLLEYPMSKMWPGGVSADMRQLLLPFIVVALIIDAEAQKLEREYSIKPAEAPPAARAYVDSAYADAKRLKFYLDIGEEGKTVEAKFKYRDRRYSLEFDTLGRWLDTEVEVPLAEVPASVWSESCGAWMDTFELYRVVRVQDHRGRQGQRYYEVELRGRRDYEWVGYQYRIKEDGEVIDAQEIVLSPGHLSRW